MRSTKSAFTGKVRSAKSAFSGKVRFKKSVFSVFYFCVFYILRFLYSAFRLGVRSRFSEKRSTISGMRSGFCSGVRSFDTAFKTSVRSALSFLFSTFAFSVFF